MSWQAIKKLNEDRGQVMADMKVILKTAEDEKRDITDDESTKFEELSAKAEVIKADVERRQRLYDIERDADASRSGENREKPGRADVSTRETEQDDAATEKRAAFGKWLRGTVTVEEQRSLTISAMGVVGDRTVYDQLVKSIKTFAGVRQAGATVLPTDTGNDLDVPTSNDTTNTGQLVGEATTDNTEADPTLGTVTLKAWKFDSKWIKVSTEMLQDASFPLEQHILDIAGERIGRAFNTYTTTGTGTGQPKGFLVGGTVGKVAAATNAITYEELLDLIHSVDAGYRESGNFRLQLHDTTLAAIRKLKDGDNRYIFAAGSAGAPAAILDYPYVVNNSMPQLSSGVSSKVVAAGDFKRYFVRDVTSPIVRRADELFIGDGLVGFRVFSRHDGNVVDSAAIKWLALAAA